MIHSKKKGSWLTVKLSYGGPRQRQASDTNQQIKALRQGRLKVWGLTHRLAIKAATVAWYLNIYVRQSNLSSHITSFVGDL